jgi:CheY-like chemotaxis protein
MTTILVVDDEPLLCDLIARMLESRGHRVSCCRRRGGALEAVEQERPDLVLSDMHMPQMGGQLLFLELRARGLQMPFVGMSGNPEEVDASLFDAFLQKPFRMRELLSTVEGVLVQQPVAAPQPPASVHLLLSSSAGPISRAS